MEYQLQKSKLSFKMWRMESVYAVYAIKEWLVL